MRKQVQIVITQCDDCWKHTYARAHAHTPEDTLCCVSPSVMSDSVIPTDCSLPGSSVREILQARILLGNAITATLTGVYHASRMDVSWMRVVCMCVCVCVCVCVKKWT